MEHPLLTYRSRTTRILRHAAFWIALVAYHTLVFGTYSGAFAQELKWELLALPMKMAAVYVTLYQLLPRYFERRRFAALAVSVTVVVLAAAFLQRVTEFAVVREFSNPYQRADVLLHPIKILRAVIGIYPVVALAALVKLTQSWFRRDLESEQLRREKLQAELRFLRTQIQPHFLFNTLNNLYALTLKRSTAAADVVLKLSDMLEYMLYEGDAELVLLEKELQTLETYLELERLRYGDRLQLAYDVEGDISGCSVPPMLLLPLAENAFKHGISRQIESGSIAITVTVQDDGVEVLIDNSVPDADSETAPPPESGIGLHNVRRRLDLQYGTSYEMECGERGGRFHVTLRLECRRP